MAGVLLASSLGSRALADGPTVSAGTGAICPMSLTAIRGESPASRQRVITMVLKTIPRFAQTDAVIPFLVFIKILDDPSLFGELLAPLDVAELERSSRAMDRAHRAFDIPYRSEHELPWYSELVVEAASVRKAVEHFPKTVVNDLLDLAARLEPRNPFVRLMRDEPILRVTNRETLAREIPALLERHGLHRPGATLHAYHALLRDIADSSEFEGFRVRYVRFLKNLIATEGGVTPERRRMMMKIGANALRRFYRGFAARRLDEKQRAETKTWFFWWAKVI